MQINIHLKITLQFSTLIEEELHVENTEVIYSGLWNVCGTSILIYLMFQGFISNKIAKPCCDV